MFILLQEKMSKKKLNCFKETEQLHGYTEAQRRVVKDVELSWAPEKVDWIAKEIYDQDY